MKKQEQISKNSNILQQNDHMRNLENLELTIHSISRPFPSILRVRGKINTNQPNLWEKPNLAVRLELSYATHSARISRVYTIRSFNRDTHEVEIDLIEHEDESPAMKWVHSAEVGSTIQIIGPRPHFFPNFEEKKHVLMFADETALPAIYSILLHWQDEISADIFIDSSEPNILSYFPSHKMVRMHLLQRERPDQAGKMGLLLKAAYQFHHTDHITVWAACERNEARAIRKFFLDEKLMDKKDVMVTGYWNLGVSSTILDQVRLEYYQKHLDAGKTLESFDDLDMLV